MSGPFRPLLPKSTEGKQPTDVPIEPNPKRKTVTLACQRCRTRKGKCDGTRPTCSTCSSKGFQCEYNDDPNTTPHAHLKLEYHRLERQHKDFLELFGMLRDRSEPEATTILQRLRSGADIHSLLVFIKEGDLVTQMQAPHIQSFVPRDSHSTMRFLNHNHAQAYPLLAPLDDPKANLGIKEKNILNANPKEDFSLTDEDIRNARSLQRPHGKYDGRLRNIDARRWTTVTDSNIVVANLVSLYLSWDHMTLRTLDEDYFLDQLSTGGDEYCSPLLVNAMLAAASLNYTAIDPHSSRELGPALFHEAKRLWHEEENKANVLQVPAAIFLSMWCKSNGIGQLADIFITQAIRIAQDLGLFDKEIHNEQRFDLSTRKFWKGRAIIAWGLFNWQTTHAFYMHKPIQLPNPPAFIIPDDSLTEQHDQDIWNSFPLIRPEQKFHINISFKAFSELFTILYDYLRVRGISAAATDKAAEFYNANMLLSKMLAWADMLPSQMVRGSDSLPMVLDLHMFFHGIIVGVFRSLVGTESPDQGKAREIMQASLDQLRRLLYVQRYRYNGPPFNSTTIGSIHILTFALLEDLAKSDQVDPEASFYLVMCAESMKKYGEAFPEIHEILHGLLAKARERSTHLPREVAVIFDELDARFFNPGRISASGNQFPIDVQIAITDPSGAEMEDLIKATYMIDLSVGRYESDNMDI